jgi:hypothetical protein
MKKDDVRIEGHMRYKKCPECFTKLPIEASTCTACKQRVGEVDKFGIAKKPFAWKGYGLALFLWILLIYFIWWAFVRSA